MKYAMLTMPGVLLYTSLVWGAPALAETAKTQETTDMSFLSETPHRWGFETSLNYETGDLGTSASTHTVYIPYIFTRYFQTGEASFTLPLIYQESSPDISAIGGRPFRTFGRGGDVRNASGFGDILFKGKYGLLDESTHIFNISPIAQIKFPTADDRKGLGTGRFDETLGLESSKSLDPFWKAYLDLYYTFIGDPAGIDLDDEFAFDIGFGYQVSQSTLLSLLYAERTALLDGEPNPRELILGVNQKTGHLYDIFGDMSAGLSRGSPDLGMTIGLKTIF